MNKKSNKFSPEVKERAVRIVLEHRGEYPSLWAAVESIALKIGCVPQTQDPSGINAKAASPTPAWPGCCCATRCGAS